MEEFNLKELLQYMLSKLYIVLIVMLLTISGGMLYSMYLKTPMYRSTTKLVLTSETTSNTKITTSDVTLSNNLVKTYSEIIKSHDVLALVVDNLHLNMTAEQLADKVNVSSTTNTQIITVSVTDKDSAEAQRIAAELAKVFKKEIIDLYKMDNVQIVDQASLANAPYNINHIKDFVIFFVAGLALGAGVVAVRFYFDNTVKSPETVEKKVNLTVFGVVPTVGK